MTEVKYILLEKQEEHNQLEVLFLPQVTHSELDLLFTNDDITSWKPYFHWCHSYY